MKGVSASEVLFGAATAISAFPVAIVSWSMVGTFNRDWQYTYQEVPSNGSGVSVVTGSSWILTDYVSQVALVGTGYQFDATSQTMTIQWEILGCGAYKLTTYPLRGGILDAVGCDALDRAVDVYLSKWVYIRCRRPRYTC